MVLNQIDPISTIPVKLCAEQDYVTVQPAGGLEATLPNDLDPAQFERNIVLPEGPLEAPIAQGQVLGSISVSHGDRNFGTVDLIAATSLERSQYLYILDQLQRLFSKLWVKLLLLAVILTALVLALRRAIFGPSRPRRNRRGQDRRRAYSGSYRGRRR